jgi:hypothetical protein
MIEYIFEYDGTERPKFIKKVVGSDGTAVSTILNFHNEEERESLSAEQLYSHVDNLIQYIKDRAQTIESVKLDEPPPEDGWHYGGGGWAEISWANEEVLKWWEYVYYREEEEN